MTFSSVIDAVTQITKSLHVLDGKIAANTCSYVVISENASVYFIIETNFKMGHVAGKCEVCGITCVMLYFHSKCYLHI